MNNFDSLIDELQSSKTSTGIIERNLDKWCEFCSFTRFYPDLFWDLITPKNGKHIKLDLYQRIMMRSLSRFLQAYFCMPRGSAKTLGEIMVMYHTAICFPSITLSITASTKESAVKIWKEKHDEILSFYPCIADEIRKETFSKDSGRVEFKNGAVIDNLANAQSSKGLRRRRGSLEESALISKDLFEDAIEPIFNVPRTTMGGVVDPTELNHQINRFTTSGYKNSDEYEVILKMVNEMAELKGSFVFGSDWFIPVHFGRQKKAVIDKARQGNVVRFRQNYLCDWIGCSDGALINISKLMKARVLYPETECPKDKKGNFALNEYVIGVDVARSNSDSNNKSSICVLKIIRNDGGVIRQVQCVNIIEPPNGLNFKEQSIIIKKVFYKYGGNKDMTKSRVKAVIIDDNGLGKGLVDRLLEDVTDPDTNEELGCWDTINDERVPDVKGSPQVIYCLVSQGKNTDIITTFIDYVESGKLKLVRTYEDILSDSKLQLNDEQKMNYELSAIQTQLFIDEVSNLRLVENEKNKSQTVERVVKRIDKDRWSAICYALFYIYLFLEKQEEENSDYDFVFTYS